MISSPPPPPMLASASPLCSRKTYRFPKDSYANCWNIDYSALVARGEGCEDYRIPAEDSDTSIPSSWFLTAHSYTYWRPCYAHPEIRGKCFGRPQRSDDGEEMPAFPCPLTGPISTYPRRGTVNGAIIAGAGKEMPLNLSGTEVRPVQLFVRYPYLRYFNLVRTAASANSEQPFSGMSVQGRTGTEETGPSRFQTVLIGLDKEDARLIIGVSSIAHNFVLRRIGTRFFGMGGYGASYLCDRKPGGCQQSDTSGIRLFTADSAAEIHSGRWLDSGRIIIRADHPGCIEARPAFHGLCQYDGKLSFVCMASAGSVVWHVFARANLKPNGGRFVEVANASSAQGPYGAFQRIQIDGYDEGGPGNIYFAAVDNNPLDTETMLGLFPVNLGNEEEGGNGNGESFIALGLSCDGVHWSNLTRLVWSVGKFGRTLDHPVDGVVLHGDNVYFMVHTNVQGIVHDQQSHLIQYALRADALTDLTREARGTLRGCTPLGPDSPPPPTLPSLPQLLTSPPFAPPPRWPPSLPRPPPEAPPPPSTSPRLAAMLGVNLAALIVCVTCSTVTYTAFLGVRPWLRRRKRRGWSRVACVSHEEGSNIDSKATQWPNGAHEDEDAAAHEGGVI